MVLNWFIELNINLHNYNEISEANSKYLRRLLVYVGNVHNSSAEAPRAAIAFAQPTRSCQLRIVATPDYFSLVRFIGWEHALRDIV